MRAKLTKASTEHIHVMENLMQFYIYDFSEFADLDVTKDGLYEPYANLRDYWKEETEMFPYFIMDGENYLGFALVRSMTSSDLHYFSMAEFFILRKYRRKGIGGSIAEQVFSLHRGTWRIFQKESNKPAQAFWIKVITKSTNGQFKEKLEPGKRIQEFCI